MQEEIVFYDPNDVREVEVNVRNKMRSLKKNILDMIGLFKKANIILMKMEADKSYRPFTEDEMEQSVKNYTNKQIGFQVYMDITVAVSGKGQSYKTSLKIDPADILENTLRTKTHFWKTFMKRGQNKCLVVVSNKNEEDTYVAPDYFDKSFG
jgi:hypothetical protein